MEQKCLLYLAHVVIWLYPLSTRDNKDEPFSTPLCT